MVKPFQVGIGLYVDMSQIVLLMIFLMLLNFFLKIMITNEFTKIMENHSNEKLLEVLETRNKFQENAKIAAIAEALKRVIDT